MRFVQCIIVIFLFLSCGNSNRRFEKNTSSNSSYEENSTEEAEELSSIAINKQNIPLNRKIIWTADMEVQVEDINKSQEKISELIAKNGAFISEMRRANENYEIYNHITIRVSSDKFNTLLNEIKSNGLYTQKLRIQSNDVTEEFIDIQSRLKTKEEVRERYINILKTKTGKISEVLEAEEAIRVITEEIEAQKGRLRYLKDQVNLSTIHAKLYQVLERPVSNYVPPSYWSKAKKAFINGWQGVTGLLLVFINIWPLILVVVLFIWKRKWFKRKFISKK